MPTLVDRERDLLDFIKDRFAGYVTVWEDAAKDAVRDASWSNEKSRRGAEVLALCGTAVSVATAVIPGGWGVAGVALGKALDLINSELGKSTDSYRDPSDAQIECLRDCLADAIRKAASAARQRELEFANELYYKHVKFKQNLQSAGQSEALKALIWSRMFDRPHRKFTVDSSTELYEWTRQAIERLFYVSDAYFPEYFRKCADLADHNVPDRGGFGTFTLLQRRANERNRLVGKHFLPYLRRQPMYEQWRGYFMGQWVNRGFQL
jgi:hypothetical protein